LIFFLGLYYFSSFAFCDLQVDATHPHSPPRAKTLLQCHCSMFLRVPRWRPPLHSALGSSSPFLPFQRLCLEASRDSRQDFELPPLAGRGSFKCEQCFVSGFFASILPLRRLSVIVFSSRPMWSAAALIPPPPNPPNPPPPHCDVFPLSAMSCLWHDPAREFVNALPF